MPLSKSSMYGAISELHEVVNVVEYGVGLWLVEEQIALTVTL